MKKRNILIAAAGVASILCVGCLALALLTDTSPAPESATAVEPAATWTPTPPSPTDTPIPSDTPTPAATPTPAMLTVRDIEVKRKELTDLQWEPYAQEVAGEPIRFSGKVIEVYDDGRVQIGDGKGLFTVCILYEIPLDVAAALNKDQFVQGEGTIRSVDTLLVLTINVNVEAIR